ASPAWPGRPGPPRPAPRGRTATATGSRGARTPATGRASARRSLGLPLRLLRHGRDAFVLRFTPGLPSPLAAARFLRRLAPCLAAAAARRPREGEGQGRRPAVGGGRPGPGGGGLG